MEHKINWRDASKELPEKEYGLYIYPSIVFFKSTNHKGEVVGAVGYDVYDERWNCCCDKKIIAWFPIKELLDTVPEEFMEMGNEQV